MRTQHYLKAIAITVLVSSSLLICMDESTTELAELGVIPFLNKICYEDKSKQTLLFTLMPFHAKPHPTAVAFDHVNKEMFIGYNDGKVEKRDYNKPETEKGPAYQSANPTPIKSLSVGPWLLDSLTNTPICIEQKAKHFDELRIWNPSKTKAESMGLRNPLKNISFNEKQNTIDIITDGDSHNTYEWATKKNEWISKSIDAGEEENSPLQNFQYVRTQGTEPLSTYRITITQCDGKGNRISIYPCPSRYIRSITFSPDGTKIAFITEQHPSIIVRNQPLFQTWKINENKQVISITDNISIWDTRSGDLVTTFNEKDIKSLALDSSNTRVALLHHSGILQLLTLGDENTIRIGDKLCKTPDLYPLIAEGISAIQAGKVHYMTDEEHKKFMPIETNQRDFLTKYLNILTEDFNIRTEDFNIRKSFVQNLLDYGKNFTAANISAFMSKYKERIAAAATLLGGAALLSWWRSARKK